MKTWTTTHIALALTLGLTSTGCTDDGGADTHGNNDETGDPSTGDGDGDSSTGDGDGDPSTGDGDGDPSTGDGDGDSSTGDGDGDPSTGDGDGDGDGLCGMPSCEDAMILDLALQADKVSEGEITNLADADVWSSTVDASAGGAMMAPMNPWVYARFTDQGLVKVDIDDIDALASGDWDIAAKRFGIRVNSGTSGPGCVGVVKAEGSFDAAETPAGTEFAHEQFYDAQCTLVEDMSGLPGNPNYLMHEWWGYSGCVTTTGNVYVIELDDGRTVAFTVDAYYAQGQQQCNEQGTMGTGSATMAWRWRFLD